MSILSHPTHCYVLMMTSSCSLLYTVLFATDFRTTNQPTPSSQPVQVFFSETELFDLQLIHFDFERMASVELVKDWYACDQRTKSQIVRSIGVCRWEKGINAPNLRDYVLTKNGWKGMVCKPETSFWTAGCLWALRYKIDGVDYLFVRWA